MWLQGCPLNNLAQEMSPLDWLNWLAGRSAEQVAAPKALGGRRNPPGEKAPGTHVLAPEPAAGGRSAGADGSIPARPSGPYREVEGQPLECGAVDSEPAARPPETFGGGALRSPRAA